MDRDSPEGGRTTPQSRTAQAKAARQEADTEWTSPMATDPTSEASALEMLGAGVELGPTLARGGEAVVHLGKQRKLGRSVAIKTASGGTEEDFARLLREARLMSRLEHPNILPVHDIFLDEHGAPQVVLKLVEGETWSKLMGEPGLVRERFGASDLLEWNIGVLEKVCQALAFAHSHGVLHRDVKPSNIMVGAFGEVYLLDWGIALEMAEADTDVGGEFPTGATVGTMSYMAPEQLQGDADQLGPWTDVYLLGATLFHALTGRPPYAELGRLERLRHVIDGQPAPELPGDTPAELRGIVANALESYPAQRIRDVESFRRSLLDFSSHRTANRLVARGDDARARADGTWERSESATTLRHLIEAEVAYRAAQSEWEECPEAESGLGDVVTLRIEHALATGEARLAARLAESRTIAPALHERVKAAARSAEAEQARLQRLAADADSGIGHATRGALGVVLVGAFILFWTWTAFDPPRTLWPQVAFTSASLLAVIAAAWRARVMVSTRLNRMVLTIVGTALIAMLAWFAGGAMLGLSASIIQTTLLLIWALAAASVATIVHPLGLPSAGGFFTAFLISAAEPAWTPWATTGAGLLMLLNHILLNRWVTGKRTSEPRGDGERY